MYPQELQNDYANTGLKESDAYPGNPDSEYGWEKLFSERLFLAYARNYGLDIRIARFHNIYGPEGTYKGGREKAPAAMCRKVIESLISLDKYWLSAARPYEPSIEVWGTGHQTRSFLYIDDCIDAVRLLMQSEFKQPINIGSEEMVTINQLAQMAIDLSGKDIKIKNISGPTPVPVIYRGEFDLGLLEKIASDFDVENKEGFVVRVAHSFDYNEFSTHVAKWVRRGHVQTDQHWMHQQVRPNGLQR